MNDGLPLPHRLAILYLMLPVCIWLAGWFEWWLGLPAVALLGAGLWPALAGSWRGSRPRPAVVPCALLALVWVMLTAAGGVFDGGNPDWLDHRTTLLDLGRQPWPVFLPDVLSDHLPAESNPVARPLLRYYLGWYMVPGWLARVGGPAALNWAVPLWTWLGVALVLLLFVRRFRGRGALWTAATIFVFFSGMDLLRGNWACFFDETIECHHIEWDRSWWTATQLSSHMTGLMWVPQHFIPAGLYTLLLLHLRRRPRFLAVSGVVLAAAPFWSAFVAIGMLPLVAVLLWENGPRSFLRWPNLCLAVPLAALVALYLTSGSLDFPSGWMWERHSAVLMALKIPVIYLTEFGALALLLVVLRPELRREPFFVAGVATLLLFPWVFFEQSNNLLMRGGGGGGMPALLVLCYYCADVIARDGREIACAGPNFRRFALAGVISVLCVGAFTPGVELARAIRNDIPFQYERSGYTTFALPILWQRENTAPDISDLLRRLLRKADASPRREKAELVSRAGFNVYLNENERQLVYVKELCSRDDLGSLVLEVIRSDAPTEWSVVEMRSMGDACGALYGLVGGPVTAIKTSQWRQGEEDWRVEILFDYAGRMVRVFDHDYWADLFGENQPAIHSDWDVYLVEDRLVYKKEQCTLKDTEPTFFLHLDPVDVNDLPSHRKQYGFDTLDFTFRYHRYPMGGEVCVAIRERPDYAIAAVRTGQYTDEGGIWEGRFNVLEPAGDGKAVP